MRVTRENLNIQKETCPIAALSTSYSTLTALEMNPSFCGGKLVTNCLHHVRAFSCNNSAVLFSDIPGTRKITFLCQSTKFQCSRRVTSQAIQITDPRKGIIH